MEGIPRFPMLAPEVKVSMSAFPEDFHLKLKEHILTHYQADPHDFDEQIKEIVNLKQRVMNFNPDVESCCSLKRYYAQLIMMKNRFPMEEGDPIEIPFCWSDQLMDVPHKIGYEDINFELACIMFNIGAVHANIGANENRDTEDSIKNAFMHFQYAAWPLQQVRDTLNASKYASLDFDKDVLTFFINVLLGQAQECLVEKSLIDHRSNVVIAKLAIHLRSLYRECTRHLETSSLCDSVYSYRYKEWVRTCAVKSELYGSIAMLYMGMQAEEEKRFGARLGYYSFALRHVQNALEIAAKDKRESLKQSASFIFDVVAAKEQNAKKENDFIYHDRVPKDEELMSSDGLCKVKPLSFDPLDPSVGGEDIFSALLPSTVLKSVSQYEEEKAKVKRRVLENISEKDQELSEFLSSLGVDELGLSGEGDIPLPDVLLERNASFNSQPNAFPQLLDKLNRISTLSEEADVKLPQLLRRLAVIDLPNIVNDEGFKAIKSELDKLYEQHLNTRQSNGELQQLIASQSENLRVLGMPLGQLSLKLRGENVKPADTPEGCALKRILDKVYEMQAQRLLLVQRLDEEMQRDSIAKKLLAERDHDNTTTFSRELEKHSEILGYIEQNLGAQERIVHALTEANADFADFRLKRNRLAESRNDEIMRLVTAFDVYSNVLSKADSILSFYSNVEKRTQRIMPALEGMESIFANEKQTREREKKMLEERMLAIQREKEAKAALSDFGVGPMDYNPPTGGSGSVGAQNGGNGGAGARNYMEFFRSKMGGGGGGSEMERGGAYGGGMQSPTVPRPMSGISPMDPSYRMPMVPPSPTPSVVSSHHPQHSPRYTEGHSNGVYSMQSPTFPHPSAQFHPMQNHQQNMYSQEHFSPHPPPPVPQPIFSNGQQQQYNTHQHQPVPPVQQQQQSYQPPQSHQPYQPPPQSHVGPAVHSPLPPSSIPQQPLYNPSVQAHQYSQQTPYGNASGGAFTNGQGNAPGGGFMNGQGSDSRHQVTYPPSTPMVPPTYNNQSNPVNTVYSYGSAVSTPSLGVNGQPPINNGQQQPIDNGQQQPINNGQQPINNLHHPSYVPTPPPTSMVSVPYSQQTPHHQSLSLSNSSLPLTVPPQQTHSVSAVSHHIPPSASLDTLSHNPIAPPTSTVHSSAFHPIQPAVSVAPVTSVAQPHPSMMPLATSSSPWHQGMAVPHSFNASPWHSGVPPHPQSTQPSLPSHPSIPPQSVVSPQPQPPPVQTQPIHPSANQYQNNQQQNMAPSSNVDLLGSLLGDLHLPPVLQPSNQKLATEVSPPAQSISNNVQSIEKTNPPVPPILSSSSVSVVSSSEYSLTSSSSQPTAIVAPMPQIVENTKGSGQLSSSSSIPTQSTVNTVSPMVNVNKPQHCVLPISDVCDPSKFVLGPEDRSKLEKKILHASFKGDSSKPSLDPTDPLNSLDPFWKAK